MAYTATLSCLHLLDCLNSDGFHCYFNTGNLPCLHSLSYLTQLHPQCCLSWPAISKETLRQYLADRLYLTHICCLAIAPLHTSPNFRSLCLVICCPIYWQISHLTSTIIRMHWNIPKLTPLLINMRMYLQASITFVIISCLIILVKYQSCVILIILCIYWVCGLIPKCLKLNTSAKWNRVW